MNTKMTATCRYADLNEFLAKHSAKDKKKGSETVFTHTRIPDKELNIYPGSYIIPKEDLDVFYKHYYESIFVKKHKEYLTERQLEVGGPMAVDIDLKYHHDVTRRQHTDEHISDMICEYLEIIKECYLVEPEKTFETFIFEKPNVNRLADGSLTKDGIHMIIGLQVDHTMQLIIRDKMLIKLSEIWSDLPLISSWDSILDEGISTGKTVWQLFGSRKPGHEAYELTNYFKITLDKSDNLFRMKEIPVGDFDLKNNFSKLSVQYDKHPKFEMNPKIIDEYNKRIIEKKIPSGQKASSKTKMSLIIDDDVDESNDEYIPLNDIVNKETLEKAVNLMLKNLEPNEYEINETHQFTQALPEKYYEPGSHLLNRQVAFALKQTDERLFLSWVMLRSKASDFDYKTIPELYCLWKKFHKSNQEGGKVTKKSILYWVRKENFDEYEKIKKNTVDHYLEKAFETGTEYDIAVVLKQMYKEKYVCTSYDKKGIWYHFENHRWVRDKGLSLRQKISEELFAVVETIGDQIYVESNEYTEDDARKTYLQKKYKVIGEIKIRLKRTNDKNNIMREAAEIFYDGSFERCMDTNKYLLGFNNGVIDFDNKMFREGYPEDYITKSTKIYYIPFEELTQNKEYIEKCECLTDCMNKLFPISDLNRYMWDHLASCLIGTNHNQTFNVYHGSGGNGKSLVAELMERTLGDYKWLVPLTLVTESRNRVGGTSDELLKLKGVRYAVIQEPTKGVKLNEGVMKELTGGDPIQARGLYAESEIFEPQFNLVVCTNTLFDVESNDDGTWRRIRKCDFLSKFIKEGETYNTETPYVYLQDPTLKKRLPELAPVFASMLVKRAFETDGIVKDCETVLNSSKKYRKREDHISGFVSDKIIKTGDSKDRIKKTELIQEFKKWFEESQGSRKIPKGEELYEYMNSQFGNAKSTGWHGIKIIYPEDEDDEEVIAEV